MARIPYQAYPTEKPIPGTGARGISLEATPEMFGATVARATEGLGQTLDTAGDKLINRALAFQELDNHNAASMRSADFADAAGTMHEQHRTLQGTNAVENFKTFPDTLEKKRQEIRETLPNDSAKKLYDSESRGLYTRTVMSAAGWSASQHRKATDDAFDADVLTQQKQAGMFPDDPKQVEDRLAQIEQSIRAKGAGLGQEESSINYDVFKGKSGALKNALIQIMPSKPFEAAKRLKEYSANMTPDDLTDVKNKLDVYRRNVGSRNIVADLRSGRDTSPGERTVGIERAKLAIGGFESGNNYGLVGPQTRHGHALGRYQVMEEFLPEFLRNAGMPGMTRDAFLADRGAQDELFARTFGGYMQQYGSFNEAASHWFTGTSVAEARAKGRTDVLGTNVDRYLTNTNAILGRTASERELMADAESKGNAIVSPSEDPLFITYLQGEVQRQTQTDRRLEQEKKLEDTNNLIGALSKPGADGKYVGTEEELFRDPQTKASYMALDDRGKEAVQKHLIANASKGYVITPEKVQRYNGLLGMLATQEGREDFVTVDLLKEKLPNDMYRNLLTKQGGLKIKGQDDPRITGLLKDGEVQSSMDTLGISHAKDKDAYYGFIGTLQQSLDAAQASQGAPLSRKEMKEVYQGLVKQEVTKGFIQTITFGKFGSPALGDPFFQKKPTGDMEQSVWDDLMKDPTFAASDERTQQGIFAAIKYQKIWGERKAKKP